MMRVVLKLLLVIAILMLVAGCNQVRTADAEYEQVLEQIDAIQERLGERELYELTPEDLAWLEDEFQTLSHRIDRLEGASDLPLGLDRVAERGSARYRAMTEMLAVAQLLSDAGQSVANIGYDTMLALDDTGVRADSRQSGDTWLDVLQRRDSELYDSLDTIHEALQLRADIDEEQLPGRVQARLDGIDSLIDRFSEQLELAEELPLAFEGLGAESPVRYLILFQNPAEMRPTGGFIGTLAQLELTRGQISDYEFHDVYELIHSYQEQSEFEVDPPWAVREFVRSDDLQIQDANWFPHFPDSAELLLDMIEAAGMGGFDGVIAVQPETVQDLIAVTGAITVAVDGEEREITSDNVYEESERQRRLQREGGESETDHKEVIELISAELINEVSGSEREDLIEIILRQLDRLDQRDIQIYHVNADLQGLISERNWSGSTEPEPGTPTLSATFANITGLKTSLVMQPDIHISLSETDSAGTIEAMLTLGLNHEGAEEGDPFYEGFQRWWVDIALPEAAMLLGTMPDWSDDPDASNGGAFVVDLDVAEREEIVIRWSMPETDRLLLRRQPGLVLMQGTVEKEGCVGVLEFTGDSDQILLLDDECPVVESFVDDET